MNPSDAAGRAEGMDTARGIDPGSEAHGLLLVDKPEGPTSHDVVEVVRRALDGTRCGHAGTLDPFASGVLVLGIGKATRLLRFLSGADKAYDGTIRLGVATDTDDRTGRPLHDPRPIAFTDEELEAAITAQTGAFEQVTPGFSARKSGGVPSYRLARRGREIPRRASTVRVLWEGWRRVGPGLLRIRVTVSAGTYIRAIARDLGETLGCGGHLESLRRTRSGPFEVESALQLPAPTDAERRARLLESLVPLRAIPLGLPTEHLSEEEAQKMRAGSPFHREHQGPEVGFVRLLGPSGDLAGVAEAEKVGDQRLLRPRIVL